MKKSILLIISLLAITALSAQNKFAINGTLNTLYNSATHARTDSQSVYYTTFGQFGINLLYRYNDKISFKSGVHFTYQRVSVNNELANRFNWYRLNHVHIPLLLTTDIYAPETRRIYVFYASIEYGLNLDILVKDWEDVIDHNNGLRYIREDTGFSKFVVSPHISIPLGIRRYENWRFYIAPVFQYSMNNYVDNKPLGKRRAFKSGYETGISYYF